MSLNWDMREVARFEPGEDTAWMKGHGQYSETLIWYVMFTGLGWQVTEENVEEFIARIRVLESWGQEITVPKGQPMPEEAIRAHVGLRVNVSPEPRAKWLLRQFAHAFPAVETGCPKCSSKATPTAEVTWTDDSGMRARLDSMVLETRCPDCSHLIDQRGAYGARVLVVS